jgi:hypothetical protein
MLQFGASLLTTLVNARIVNYDCNCSFIVLATVIMIVNYDRHLFIVQATGDETTSRIASILLVLILINNA